MNHRNAQRLVFLERICPDNHVEEYASVAVENWLRQDNPVESRPKPSPLLGNATPQSKQFDYEGRCGYQSKTFTSMPNQCPDGNTYYGIRIQYEYPTYDHSLFSHGDAPWMLGFGAKVKGLRQSLGNYLVEAKDSKELLSETSRMVKDAWKCVRKGKTRSCRRIKNAFMNGGRPDVAAANTVLLSNFGINPMLGDLHETASRLSDRVVKPILTRVVYTGRKSGLYSSHFTEPDGRMVKQLYVERASARAVGWLKLQPASSEQFQMGNPLELAWEAIPFSFVADYLIPVGTWLSTVDALAGWELVELTITHKRTVQGEDHSAYPGWEVTLPYTWTYKEHRRDVQHFWEIPDFPSVDPTDSVNSLVNSLSLLHSVRNGAARTWHTR